MSPTSPTSDTNEPQRVETACGAHILITPQAPTIRYQGELIYFCGQDCRQLYSEDPLNSCLASRLLSGK